MMGPQTQSHSHTPTQHQENMFVGAMAKSYNARTGGCNIQLADHLIALTLPHLPKPPLPPSPPTPLRILDNASGPLVLTTQILETPAITQAGYKPIRISAVDLSPDFVRGNKEVIAAHAATMSPINDGRVEIESEVMDGMALAFPDETFDASFTSLAIFAFPDPVRGAREVHRTLKPGGVAALTTWKRVAWMDLLREVEREIRPPGSEPARFPMVEAWMVSGKLTACLIEGGFEQVEEGDVIAVAWFDSVEIMAGRLSETLKLMVGDQWTVGEKERMEEGFLGVLRDMRESRVGSVEGFLFEEGGRAGAEMVAYTAVARK